MTGESSATVLLGVSWSKLAVVTSRPQDFAGTGGLITPFAVAMLADRPIVSACVSG